MRTDAVKARQDYVLIGLAGAPDETVRVVGHESIEHPTRESGWTETRTERWHRVRLSDGGRLIVHASALRPV